MVKYVGTKVMASWVLVIATAVMLSCAGHSSSIGTPPMANIAGAWEFIATSQTGSKTGIEVAWNMVAESRERSRGKCAHSVTPPLRANRWTAPLRLPEKLGQQPDPQPHLTGADNTSVTLSGLVTGTAFNLYGTVQRRIVTYRDTTK